MKKASMRDVAQKAGVSIATVSHVINGTRFVKSETREKVIDAMDSLNYKAIVAANNQRNQHVKLIACIVPDITNDFFSTIIDEMENSFLQNGYRLLVVNTKESSERELDALLVLSEGMVEGFVIASTLTRYEEMRRILPPNAPVVLIDREIESCPYDMVTVTNYAAMYNGVSYLIHKGHKKIGYISGIQHVSTSKERCNAYKSAMFAHQLNAEEFICLGDSMTSNISHIDKLLSCGCTAIVVSNGIMAVDAMTQILQKGLRFGKDIDFLGYKDSEQMVYGFQNVGLIYQPTLEIAHLAGKLLMERIKSPNIPARHTVIQAQFVSPEHRL